MLTLCADDYPKVWWIMQSSATAGDLDVASRGITPQFGVGDRPLHYMHAPP